LHQCPHGPPRLGTPPDHYVRFGFYEHRPPYKVDIDEAWYLRTYPDVKIAVERQRFASGQEHFEADGYRETPSQSGGKDEARSICRRSLPHNLSRLAPGLRRALNQIVDKRFDKRQSMRWTPRGARLMLQTRTRVLNGDLDHLIRCRYPAFRSLTLGNVAPALGWAPTGARTTRRP
jgi:hypothetical protein